MAGQTLFHKIWQQHVVEHGRDGVDLLYIDRHLVHEVTSPQAFSGLRESGRVVRRPDATLAVCDHAVPTREGREKHIDDACARRQVEALRANCAQFGITYFGVDDIRQGIVHVIGPEQGFTQPGMTIVCGDSHTSTHGAFGALAFGIGTSEVEHVLATQTLRQRCPQSMKVTLSGHLRPHVTAKDMILAVIGAIGTAGGTGYVIEYGGDAVTSLSLEGRMSMCNMSIEAGARAGLVAVDEKTIDWLKGRPQAPRGQDWHDAVRLWRQMRSDEDSSYDHSVSIDVATLAPQVTWGTSPQDVVDVDGVIPDPKNERDVARRLSMEQALSYMGLKPSMKMTDIPVERVFIGSCTNGRLEDLRAAASIVKGHKVKDGVKAMVVPGSGLVRCLAEEEGIDRIFKEAGFEWRLAGCSMCLAMNDDKLSPHERCLSTSNRNFEGRQGRQGRTHLANPAMAAAAAITGHITDVRDFV
ncbi:MAG: 3-isopropylmalate dehydratase large subunit [Alphaproteobacteria bacterium GM7ARS4]|nr:3-isopropylmalate dehydratase large subunit [Alphaproteobacteria bacterium GM7ARS4]